MREINQAALRQPQDNQKDDGTCNRGQQSVPDRSKEQSRAILNVAFNWFDELNANVK